MDLDVRSRRRAQVSRRAPVACEPVRPHVSLRSAPTNRSVSFAGCSRPWLDRTRERTQDPSEGHIAIGV
eukprot:8077829-Pyramimonas_sp.AAC.1